MLAVHITDGFCPLTYKAATPSEGCFIRVYKAGNEPKIGETVNFDPLKFPFSFSFGVGVRSGYLNFFFYFILFRFFFYLIVI